MAVLIDPSIPTLNQKDFSQKKIQKKGNVFLQTNGRFSLYILLDQHLFLPPNSPPSSRNFLSFSRNQLSFFQS